MYRFRQLCLIFFILLTSFGMAQLNSARQKTLENQKKRLQEEIKQINTLLFKNTKKEKSLLSQVEDLNIKISVRSDLVKVNNQQANLLTQQINVNQRNITDLRKELEALKKDYAEMIQKSYKSKSSQNRLMFLFSSEEFLQAYKRVQYMKQYANFRKKQGEEIAEKTTTLQSLNKTLLEQKAQKENLVIENRKVKQQLQQERKSQQKLIKGLKNKSRSLAADIKQRQLKASAIDREIKRLIREAIAASNRTAGKKGETKDSEIIKVLRRMKKQRQESADLYKKGGRQELLEIEEEEIKIIDTFLPKQLNEEETKKICKEVIESVGASSIKDIGKIMSSLKQKYSDSIDFSKVSVIVKGLLGQ